MTHTVESATHTIRSGGVICHATEGVWGLACDPFCEAAVQRILQIKARSVDKGLLLIGATVDEFAPELAACTPTQAATIRRCWPGAHTWILPNSRFPAWVTGGRDTVGCRVPGHDQARSLCELAGVMVSTSANLSGEPSVLTQDEAEAQFASLVDLIVPGAVNQAGQASAIHNLDGTLLR